MTKEIGRKYVPKVANMHKVCEVNYGRLLKLLPDCDTEDLQYQFEVNDSLLYSIKIIECSRYTSTLEMSQKSPMSYDFLSPEVQVRLYHDAKMAEVISAQNIGSLQPSYRYPNIKMYQKNEKEMVNLFLAEWLQFCLAHSSQLYSSEA
ncbi:DUF1249 domain-containing protein [Paraglaciecola arctica]|uniref:Cytoplasmic protein n=1 Tax=Paraglaciecola arctica BSs20135 TaxID=493475 RepID=K6XEI8_9ALTE|nr:DUF1249 domain-containing protein [Paraglaciecola arctica]GAC19054.1 hypothetical protein GARC_2087 [Paraglaciecola arctica BSs20135]|tara:strand:+ start:4985 stop:5428 length:444 start_codon:yes stop_codon:yes gene_type:complete